MNAQYPHGTPAIMDAPHPLGPSPIPSAPGVPLLNANLQPVASTSAIPPTVSSPPNAQGVPLMNASGVLGASTPVPSPIAQETAKTAGVEVSKNKENILEANIWKRLQSTQDEANKILKPHSSPKD